MMRGLRERGQCDIITRLASGVLSLDYDIYKPSMVLVEATRHPLNGTAHRWVVEVESLLKPWTPHQATFRFFGKTKGAALDSAIKFFHGLTRSKKS